MKIYQQKEYPIYMMWLAINEALKAAYKGYIPVGAVIVKNNIILYKGHNQGRFKHIELEICDFIFKNNIIDYDMYITLEPCIGCGFFLLKTKFKNIFFGAYNQREGISKIPIANSKKLCILPLIHKECQRILQKFFLVKR